MERKERAALVQRENVCERITDTGSTLVCKTAPGSSPGSKPGRRESGEEAAAAGEASVAPGGGGGDPTTTAVRRSSSRTLQLPPLAFRQAEQTDWGRVAAEPAAARPTSLAIQPPPLINITSADPFSLSAFGSK
ncbi:hypothetical protein AALO_G00163640 [Alosa alosa]|uniref:Uncharacterized protein n=1 Tax=Alosa alosa TaxID=278164 RepID=A0AAV6GFF5_9TELE|nr:hypothetical protein AALO_G00163640 [Alosa alosa]